MKVQPITGEPLRFYVHSESDTDASHVVDLSEMDGNAACSCEDWTFRCAPRYREGKRIVEYPDKQRTRCKHINAAVLYYANQKLKQETAHAGTKPEKVRKTIDGLPF